MSAEIIEVAMDVCEKRVRDMDEIIDDPEAFTQLVTDEEWLVLGADELNQEELQKKKHEVWLKKNDIKAKAAAKKKRKNRKKVSYEPSEVPQGFGSGKNLQGKQKHEGAGGDEYDEEYGYEDNEEEEEENEQDIMDKEIGKSHPEYARAIAVLKKLLKDHP